MPLYEYKCPVCETVIEDFQAHTCKDIPCPCGDRAKWVFSVCGISVNRANDLDYFGTPKYAEDRAKQCGVPI